jgi:uncharacterized protein (DUF983 family)
MPMNGDMVRSAGDTAVAGVFGRCPRCGRGRLFAGYLTPAQACESCGLDYAFADSGDGPAVFVIMIVGFLVVGLALWLEVAHGPPLWLHFVLWIPLAVLLGLAALRVAKGLLIAFQYRNRAAEGRLEDRQ